MENEGIASELKSAFFECSHPRAFYPKLYEILKDHFKSYHFHISVIFISYTNPTFNWQPVYRSSGVTRMKNITPETFKGISHEALQELINHKNYLYINECQVTTRQTEFYVHLRTLDTCTFFYIPFLSTSGNVIGWLAIWNQKLDPPLNLDQSQINGLANLIHNPDQRILFQYLRNVELFEDMSKSYNKLIETSEDFILIRSKTGLILQVNDFVEKTLGYKKSDFVGKYINEVEINGQRVFLDVYILKKEEIDAAVKHQKNVGPIMVFDINGNLHILERTISNYDLFEFPAIQVRAKDITEIKKLEAESINHEQFESLTTLARGIAHDVNNLLQAISGNVSILRLLIDQESTTSNSDIMDIVQDLETIVNNSERFSNRLTNLTEIESTYRPQPIELVQIISDIGRFYLAGTSISLVLEKNLDELWIYGDIHSITQISSNLLINARDALDKTEHPEVQISFQATDSHAVISFHDNGSGIAKEIQSKIFLPYFTTKTHGSGLGLSSTLAKVKQMSGSINIISEPGNTTFTLNFPRLNPEIQTQQKGQTLSKSDVKMGLVDSKIHLLIVDDSDYLLKSLRTFLTMFNIHCYTAQTQEEAISLLKNHVEIQCIIIDYHLKSGDGAKLIDDLNSIRTVKSILYSGSPNSIHQNNLATIPDRILSKPIRLDDLLKEIQSLVILNS